MYWEASFSVSVFASAKALGFWDGIIYLVLAGNKLLLLQSKQTEIGWKGDWEGCFWIVTCHGALLVFLSNTDFYSVWQPLGKHITSLKVMSSSSRLMGHIFVYHCGFARMLVLTDVPRVLTTWVTLFLEVVSPLRLFSSARFLLHERKAKDITGSPKE